MEQKKAMKLEKVGKQIVNVIKELFEVPEDAI